MLDAHKHWIEKLARIADPAWQDHCRQVSRKVFAFEPVEELPFIAADPPNEDDPWPTYPYNDAFADPEKMLMNELAKLYGIARAWRLSLKDGRQGRRDYRPLNIRCNYGTVVLPSMLGADWRLTDNSMPWAHHVEGGVRAIEALIDAGPPEPTAGLGGRCFETADYYRHILGRFPPLDRCVDVYHPDLQGPYDVAHLLMGPDIFTAGYDQPELVERLTDLVTRTYRRFVLAWDSRVGFNDSDGMTTHWSFFIGGKLMLRNDTATLLSPRHYERFVRPFDQRLLEEFGGCIHFCGRATQLYESMLATGRLAGLHCAQPDLNDCPRLLALAQAARVALLAWPARLCPADISTGAILAGPDPRSG